MADTGSPKLSVAGLFADREARRRKERAEEEAMARQRNEELAQFKRRLENFQLTDDIVSAVMERIRRAFDRGETELMLTSFPSSFCSDNGRAIINADAPPINKPKPDEEKPREPEWLATMPAGARLVYNYWKEHLEAGGFRFSARIINYPGGMPGDVGLFFSWPKSETDIG